MVTATLVEKNIKDGETLIRALDKRGDLVVKGALWFFNPESEIWRLIIASPFVDEHGPKEAYKIAQEVLKDISSKVDITLDEISMVGYNDDLIRLFRGAIHVSGISGVRFRRNVIDNTFVEDAYIYRMEK